MLDESLEATQTLRPSLEKWAYFPRDAPNLSTQHESPGNSPQTSQTIELTSLVRALQCISEWYFGFSPFPGSIQLLHGL
jgi:hypothetical protein